MRFDRPASQIEICQLTAPVASIVSDQRLAREKFVWRLNSDAARCNHDERISTKWPPDTGFGQIEWGLNDDNRVQLLAEQHFVESLRCSGNHVRFDLRILRAETNHGIWQNAREGRRYRS